MVPDPPSRPLLAPLFPTADPTESSAPPLPAPVNILPVKEIPQPSASTSTSPSTPTNGAQKSKYIKPAKRRHWVINRNAPSRRTRDVVEDESVPAWKTPREPTATDFGTFATLPSILAQDRKRDVGTDLGPEDKLFNVLRNSLEIPSASTAPDIHMETDEEGYWKGRAAEAEAYIRDVVYGGADGYAYVRSLAEFLTPSEPVVSALSGLQFMARRSHHQRRSNASASPRRTARSGCPSRSGSSRTWSTP